MAGTSLSVRCYLRLNRLFGQPVVVERATYDRGDRIYRERTVPWLEELASELPHAARCLVIGCGAGDEVAWFARRCRKVAATEIHAGAAAAAAARFAHLDHVDVRLVSPEDPLPFEDGSFDIVFLHDVAEHLVDVESALRDYHRVLAPGGSLVNWFSPLFYSPYGAHLQDALKIPWGHLLFGFRTIREVRNLYYPGVSAARDWNEFGLNRLTERRYRRIIRRLGFEDRRYEVITSRKLPLVAAVPLVRNLFILEVRHLARRAPRQPIEVPASPRPGALPAESLAHGPGLAYVARRVGQAIARLHLRREESPGSGGQGAR